MLPLSFIWLVTEVLAVCSLGTMLILIMRRYLAERSERAQEARLQELRPVLFACLDRQEPLEQLLKPLRGEDRTALVLLARRLINPLTGEGRRILVKVMERLGHVDQLLAALRDGPVSARLQAAGELAWFDRNDVRNALRAALRDRFYGVRVAAAESLLALGCVDAQDEIVHYLTDQVDPCRSACARCSASW